MIGCKYCGQVNEIGTIFCDNCGKQLKDVKKYESLDLEELNKLKMHKHNKGVILLTIFFHCLAFTRVLFFLVVLIFSSTIIASIVSGIIIFVGIISFIIGCKMIFDISLVTYTTNLKSEDYKKCSTITRELFFTGQLKKSSKEKIQELNPKFQQFEVEFDKIKLLNLKKNKKSAIYLFFMVLGFSICIPVNYFTKDVFLSVMVGFSCLLIFIYPLSFTLSKLSEQCNQINMELFSRLEDPKDTSNLIYYINSIGLKYLNKYGIICNILLLFILAILIINIMIN